MTFSARPHGRLLQCMLAGICLLQARAEVRAEEAEYAIRWMQPEPLTEAFRKQLVDLLKMTDLKSPETFTVRYLQVQRQPDAMNGFGDPILRVRTKHVDPSGKPDPGDKVTTTLKYRGSAAAMPDEEPCPLGSARRWERERDVTWLPPWRAEVLAAIASRRGLLLDTAAADWPLRTRVSASCDGKGDLGLSFPAGWVVKPAPCSTLMRRTEAASGLRIEEWGDPAAGRPALIEVSRKYKLDDDKARAAFTLDVATPLMVVAGVVPEIDNKTELSTELSSCR